MDKNLNEGRKSPIKDTLNPTLASHKTTSGLPKKALQNSPKKRLPLRALTLVSLLLLFTIFWLYWHFLAWYHQKVGDTTSLLSTLVLAALFLAAFFKLLVSDDDSRKFTRAWLRRIERSRRNLWLLGAADFILALLLLLSNSYYVNIKDVPQVGSAEKITKFTIKLQEEGVDIGPTTEISAENPLFFKFRLNWPLKKHRITLRILKPALYHSVDRVLWMGGNAQFSLPPEDEEYYAVRVVPGRGLYHDLTPPSSQDPSLYDLQVSIGTETPKTINLTKTLLYFGPGGKDDLKLEAERQSALEWKQKLCAYIQTNLPGTGECETHPFLTEEPRYESINFGKNDSVSVQVLYSSRIDRLRGMKPKPIMTAQQCRFSRPGIMTIYLEKR